MDCKNIPGCIFFNDKMVDMPMTAEMFKQAFCKENYKACARFIVAATLGKHKVPNDLFPNQDERAKNIIFKR